jgi:uncharacterized protein YcfJ
MKYSIIILSAVSCLFSYNFNIPPLPWDTAGQTVVHVTNETQFTEALWDQTNNRTIVLHDTIRFTLFDTSFHWDLDGCENVMIRGTSDNAEDVALIGRGFSDTSHCDTKLCAGHVIRFINCKNCGVANFSVRGWGYNGIQWEGDSTDGILVHNINSYNVGQRHIKGSRGHCKNVEIRYCRFENDSIQPTGYIFGGDYVAGMDIMGADVMHVHHNFFKNIRGAQGGGRAGIFVWRSSRETYSYSNVFINCDRSIAYGNSSDANPGTNHMTGGGIYNNFITAGTGRTIELCEADSIKVFHNTFYTAMTNRIIYSEDSYGGQVKNNLFTRYQLQTNGGDPPVVENNITSGASPLWFVNTSTGDLHLRTAQAAAVNQGLDLSSDVPDDFDGFPRDANPDIGADEWDNILGVKDRVMGVGKGIGIECWPNPFSTSVFFEIRTASSELRNLQTAIYDIQGKLVQKFNNRGSHSAFRSTGYTWYTSGQSSGIYLIRVDLGNGRKIEKRVVLSR